MATITQTDWILLYLNPTGFVSGFKAYDLSMCFWVHKYYDVAIPYTLNPFT